MNPIWEGLTPPYGAIVMDAPWRYTKTPNPKHSDKRSKIPSAEGNYSTMSHDEIAALPVQELAAENSHLYLWVTNPKMFVDRDKMAGPYEMMKNWGFTYMTTLTWIKEGAPGMGFYFRGNTEHVLFGVKGHCPIPPEKREPNWFVAPKTTHSTKPDCFMDMVERVSPGPYVELFSRQPRFFWDSWGKGVEIPEIEDIEVGL